MICPACQAWECHRSRRRGVADLLAAVVGLRPWRCPSCRKRFYAWRFFVFRARYAHCPRCGNLELQRIARKWVDEGALRWLYPMMGAPAYRCDPCRQRFFSLLPAYRGEAAPARTIARGTISR